MNDSVTVDASAPMTFGGDVRTVLESPRATMPPQTLEEARNQPGRREQIEAITKQIQSQGIKYVFFQQVSVTGRVMGKGVVASFFPQVAERGYQLVYGATANLFVDRAGDYIGFGPEASELAAIADLSTFAQLPWDPRVARVFCDCYDTETGELLDADPRQNLKRVVNEFEQELGYQFLIGIEPEMMWLKKGEEGSEPEGVTKPYCYHIHQFEELRPVLLDVVEYGQALGLDMSYGDHEDAPGQLELNFRFDRPVRTADNATTYRQICAAVGRKHGLLPTFMPKPFTGVSANGHHHHFTLMDDEGNNVFHDKDGPAQLSDTARHFLGGMLEHFGALMCIGNPTVNSYCRMWDFGFWAPVYKNWGWQNRTCTVRVASGGRFEYRGVDSSCNPYLTIASLLYAGLDGIRNQIDPGEPQSRNTYDILAEHASNGSGPNGDSPLERVPDSLGAALEALDKDELIKSAMPGRLYDVFKWYKRDEWERYLAAVTDWERDEYLEVLP
jgi:glutamine synthetase